MANILDNLFNPSSRIKQFLLLAGLFVGAAGLLGFIDGFILVEVFGLGFTWKQVIGALLGFLWYWVWQKRL